MFENIPHAPADKILALMTAFRADERSDKIDLGVGVYKDANGATPVMQAVKQSESQLLQSQSSKTYVGPAGDPVFCEAIRNLVFGSDHDTSRIRALQTPGGSGALKVIADMLEMVNPDADTWVPDPTWPNHIPLLAQAGHTIKQYEYYDSANNQVNFDGMLKSLAAARAGDAVLLHGCCHNPTGADLTLDQWQSIAELCIEKKLLPFIDLAYQGFGEGLEEDAAAVRLMATQVPEMVVASSCSKNLALYRDRVGTALVMGADADAADRAIAKLATTVRANYSMPPDHGAAVVSRIFQDDELQSVWKTELNGMRVRMQRQRVAFAEALRKRSNSDQFDYIAHQRGMFSRLPLLPEHIEQLREQHGIYIVGDGRVNVAGLPETGMDELAEKIVAAISADQ